METRIFLFVAMASWVERVAGFFFFALIAGKNGILLPSKMESL